MVVRICDLISGADTADQGRFVQQVIAAALNQEPKVVVSFKGIQTASSSFVHAAFVPLLASYSLDELKKRMDVVDSNRQINDMIKRGLTRPQNQVRVRGALAGERETCTAQRA